MKSVGEIAKVLALVAPLAGCAVAPDIHKQAAAIASMTPCCASERALPAALPAVKEQELKLLASSPHYDFGSGLAPFARLALSPTTTALEIQAHPEGSSSLLGGDGSIHYANFTAIFYDDAGNRLPSDRLQPAIKTVGMMGSLTLVANASVPAGAKTVVISTKIDSIGRTNFGTTTPATMIKVGAAFVPVGGGAANIPMSLAPYGELTVFANGL